jgi:hypothetical protein
MTVRLVSTRISFRRSAPTASEGNYPSLSATLRSSFRPSTAAISSTVSSWVGRCIEFG